MTTHEMIARQLRQLASALEDPRFPTGAKDEAVKAMVDDLATFKRKPIGFAPWPEDTQVTKENA